MKKEKNSKIKEILITIPPFFLIDLSKCEELNDLINNVSQSNSIDKQVSIIKSISTLDVPDKYKTLSMLFLICPYKHPSKKTIARILSSKQVPDELIINNLQDYIKKILKNDKKLKYFRYAMNTCFDNFPQGIQAVQSCLNDIFKLIPDHLMYFNSLISKSNPELKYILEEVHDYSRAIIYVVSLCLTQNIQISELISETTSLLIQNSLVPMDTKCNFGMIIIHCVKQHNNIGITEIICKLLNIKLNQKESWPEINFSSIPEKICITVGILNTLTISELYQIINNSDALIILLGNYLFQIADTSCALLNTDELLVVCRGIVLISKKCNLIMEDKNLKFLQMFIKFVLIHIEHYIDTIRHNSKVIMINLVKNAVQLDKNGDSFVLNELIKAVFEMSNNNESGFYSCLSILCVEAGCNSLLKYNSNLTHKLMTDVYISSTYTHQIRTTYVNLMKKHSTEVDNDVWRKLWIDPLVNKIIEQNIFDDDNLSLFHEAISIKPELSIEIIENHKNNYKNPAVILVCAKIARKFGISASTDTNNKWKGIIDLQLLENVFSHASPTIRLSAIAVIADSRKTTEIFNEIDFKLIIKFLMTNLNCPEPPVRQEILAYYKKIFTRVKDTYLVLKRKWNDIKRKLSLADSNKPIEENITKKLTTLRLQQKETGKLIEAYENFNEEIRDVLLKGNLDIGANYYRRNSTLEMYTLLKSIVDEIFPQKFWSEIKATNLISCLNDGYEHNKKLALNILVEFPLQYILQSSGFTINAILETCMKLSTSKKPADCITGAYLLHLTLHYSETCEILKLKTKSKVNCSYYLAIRMLIIELRNEISVAKENIATAAGTAPLYGRIFVIRYLYQQVINKNLNSNEIWIDIIKEVIDICFEISDLVLPIVNNQSPEGYLPDNFSNVALNNSLIVTPQMILLCAWRSVKEISLLFGEISAYSNIIDDKSHVGTISQDQIILIGNYFISVLATTKHRGAFEQTYVGFIKLCKRLWSEKSGKLTNLPKNWINELLVDITNTDETNKKLCATRRSAGLPFMIQALESTALEVIGTTDLFKDCMDTLLHICDKYRNESNPEPCTHSMNILRALFRHNQLGELCTQFISDGVIVALRGIEGKTWGLRNAGTLLFSTLMTRIFGVLRSKNGENVSSRNRMTIHVFFSRFPSLFEFFLEELRIASSSFNNNTLKLSLYPILLLLARLYPSVLEENEPQYQISAFLPYLNQCCKDRIYKTRELAAKAIVPLLDKANLSKYFTKLLYEIIALDKSTNYYHGVLLQMLYLLKSLPAKDIQFENIWNQILKTEWIILTESYILKDVYNQILIELISKSLFINDERKQFLLRAVQILNMPSFLKTNLGITSYQLSNTKLNFNLQILYTQNKIQKTLPSIFYEALTANQTIFSFTLDCILCLLFEKSYLLDDIEFDNDLQFLNEYNIDLKQLRNDILSDTHFYNVFKNQLYVNNEHICRAKLFFLLSMYTENIHTFFNLNEIETLERLIDLCSTEYEVVCSYILNCINELLMKFFKNNIVLNENVLKKLANCLYENALPEMPYKTRRAVAELLLKHPQLYTDRLVYQNINDYDLSTIWITIQLLGNDFDETIRQTIAKIAKIDSISHIVLFESIRDVIFNMGSKVLLSKSLDMCTAYLLSWITRDTSDDIADEDCENEMLVFNKGDMNLYIEDIHLAKISISILQNIICKQIGQKTLKQYLVEVLTNHEVVNWFPNKSKHGRTMLLNLLINSEQTNILNTDIFKSDLLVYKLNVFSNMLLNV